MSNRVRCPACGHLFTAVRCRCRGYIVSAEAWKLGRWDWSWLTSAFTDGVRVMDVDALVERNGRFLAFETKGNGVLVPKGQRLALERLARLPEFRVVLLEGAADAPEFMEVIGTGQRRPTDMDGVWNYTADWWQATSRMPVRRTG